MRAGISKRSVLRTGIQLTTPALAYASRHPSLERRGMLFGLFFINKERTFPSVLKEGWRGFAAPGWLVKWCAATL